MPWYKSGTVSVTLNSNAVIGTGTAFIANSRVGDAFRGPDGAWYEVVNIASDTAMAISPNYQGATNAAGVYALAPMQGYVKDSADALRALVNTYGAKLAALGTTGNYDILPVSKGGTGGTDQPTARNNLGLGTVATVNIQTSVTDATAGRAQINGAWGWGAVSSVNAADLNAITESQKFGINTGALNIPWALGSTTVPFASGSSGIAMTWTSNHQSQIIVNRTSSMVALRRKNAGTWAPDDYFCMYPTGQTFLSISQGGTGGGTQAAARTGLGLKSAAVADIVGVVSQSGGIPTGALMEYVSSANGEAWKFACGMMICTRSRSYGLVVGDFTSYGSIWYYYGNWTFPVPFAAPPTVTGGARGTSRVNSLSADPNNTASACNFFVIDYTSPVATTISEKLVAVGRWF
ncbi:hypothetical protein [Pseudomonas sp. Z1-14]|uniref:hypothetical protein n=1 Tax=Pseudomonas sp. Z1-14 TaxID=2817409 RepID=UPI003DAA37B3